jgi:DNA polymerase III subunit beta
MQVICARDQLSEAMNLVGSIVNQRSTNPITQFVQLVADGGTLEVRATDLDLSLKRSLSEVEIKSPGKCLVNASTAAKVLGDIRAETIEIKADGSNVSLKAGRDTFELVSADPEEFPRLPEVTEGAEQTISSRDFADAIRKVGRSIAQEKGRYALNGVLLEPSKGALEFCGTDGRRLGFCRTDAKGTPADYQIIIPRKGYDLVNKVIGSHEGELKLRITENRMVAQFGGTEVGTQLVEGQFPDYRSVIPSGLDKQFSLPVDEFRSALSKARHLTSVESQAVRLELTKGELTLLSRSPAQGKAEIKVEAAYDGEDITLGFDPQYILGGLDGFDDGDVIFEFKDKDTGAIMHAGDKERFYYLVMPIDI